MSKKLTYFLGLFLLQKLSTEPTMETATDANDNGKLVCLDSSKQLHPLTGNPNPTERARCTAASAIMSLHPALFTLANKLFSRFFELKTTHERHLDTAKCLNKEEFFPRSALFSLTLGSSGMVKEDFAQANSTLLTEFEVFNIISQQGAKLLIQKSVALEITTCELVLKKRICHDWHLFALAYVKLHPEATPADAHRLVYQTALAAWSQDQGSKSFLNYTEYSMENAEGFILDYGDLHDIPDDQRVTFEDLSQ